MRELPPEPPSKPPGGPSPLPSLMPFVVLALILALIYAGVMLFPVVQNYIAQQDCIGRGRTDCSPRS